MSNPLAAKPWQPASKARAVQHAFVNARIRDINSRAITTLFTPALAALKDTMPALKKASPEKIQAIFFHLTERLQSAQLTINLMAPNWFMTPNNYDGYTQMYERAIKAGQMKLTDSDPKNPAEMRVVADEKATFPKKLVEVDYKLGAMGVKMTRHDVKAAPSAGPARGLTPGARGIGDAVQKMTPGALAQSGTEYTASNAQFDPRTRQVFAALNYGRRPHGACIDYGHSYLVLSDKFKRDALYFGGDTFGIFEGKSVTADDQISYDLLGAIYLKANASMRNDLQMSCITDGTLKDTGDKDLLLEAHLFEAVKFSGGASGLCISAKDGIKGANGMKRPLTAAEWQTIQTNARAFATRHGIRLTFIE
jgi:hypothetical protein